jgi:hypothetical protein
MNLTFIELDKLMNLLGLTQDQEIDCDQCLMHIASFAEQKLAGSKLSDALDCVEQHLMVCGECREEYELLLLALAELQNEGILENPTDAIENP